ncbi:MAG: kynureninase [Aquabacterium sp.]
MSNSLTLADCEALDRQDPLAPACAQFERAAGDAICLDGNSVGPMPKTVPAVMERALRHEWSTLRRRGWGQADWLDAPQRIGAGYAGILGAQPADVIALDNSSVLLHKLLAQGLAGQGADPRRNVIVHERDGFPTDAHVVQGIVHHGGGRWQARPIGGQDNLAGALRDDVAMVLLTHVDYRSSLRWDMAAANRAAHAVGARVLWDLSHAAGAVPVRLMDDDADYAVACSYKYLCAGPGAPALAWVHPRWQDNGGPALPGWLGHARRMDFERDYAPGPGVLSLVGGTMAVLQNKAMEEVSRIWAGVRPEDLAWKHRSLATTLLRLVDEQLAPHGVEVISPRDYDRQGGHVALRCPGGGPVCEALLAEGVVTSYRKPDTLRLGLSAMGVSHVDLWRAVQRLRDILASGRWREPRFSQVSV